MPIRKKYRQWSELFAENREFMRIYKQLTPTRNGSTLETLRYYHRNKHRTVKLFGVIDTGIRDYGMDLYSRPWHTARLYACMYRIWRIQRRKGPAGDRIVRDKWRTGRDSNPRPPA